MLAAIFIDVFCSHPTRKSFRVVGRSAYKILPRTRNGKFGWSMHPRRDLTITDFLFGGCVATLLHRKRLDLLEEVHTKFFHARMNGKIWLVQAPSVRLDSSRRSLYRDRLPATPLAGSDFVSTKDVRAKFEPVDESKYSRPAKRELLSSSPASRDKDCYIVVTFFNWLHQ